MNIAISDTESHKFGKVQQLLAQANGMSTMSYFHTVQNAHKAGIKEACPVEHLDSQMHQRNHAEKRQSVTATKMMAHSIQTASINYKVNLNTEVSAEWSALTTLSCACWVA